MVSDVDALRYLHILIFKTSGETTRVARIIAMLLSIVITTCSLQLFTRQCKRNKTMRAVSRGADFGKSVSVVAAEQADRKMLTLQWRHATSGSQWLIPASPSRCVSQTTGQWL